MGYAVPSKQPPPPNIGEPQSVRAAYDAAQAQAQAQAQAEARVEAEPELGM